ncbi:hypothetical protein DM02DRAFT_632936 [Periconia macrospinosa]|uniref:INO80 complex subunit F domain-containing protein n=1 Tax=Periconia macrospinosa TaxID=97972 RepID=A0A2V1DB72_9PLEO|nr:hypothetical protein DM02DRAFT_632936 [Periconia macrospinosa]
MPQPVVPAAQTARALSQKDLPPSVETAYYRKCIELRRRINDIEENNDNTRLRIKRLNRGVQKMRLERAFLLEKLNNLMEYNVDDSDRSSSTPPTPTDKPLRSKRSHRKGSPPAGSQAGGGGTSAVQHASPGSTHHQHALASVNPMSSAQSTPDPSRTAPFFSSVNASAASPPAVNGNSSSATTLPAPPLQPRQPESSSRTAFFDPVSDEQRPRTGDNEAEGSSSSRARAHSGAAAAPPPSDARSPENGDTEMADVSGSTSGGFTAVNNR